MLAKQGLEDVSGIAHIPNPVGWRSTSDPGRSLTRQELVVELERRFGMSRKEAEQTSAWAERQGFTYGDIPPWSYTISYNAQTRWFELSIYTSWGDFSV